MNIDHLLTTSCTITTVSSSGVDVYNDPVDATTTTTTTCWIHQNRSGGGSGGSEQTGLIDVQTERLTAYFPADTALTGHDRVTAGGVTYQVSGPPATWTNPRTGDQFVEATLRRTS